ncbi:MAG: hypothetical protein SF097_21050 [Acidobacteriota bacterium]|nr:hypothetical protein [Acidobacteriota bacterium]
MSKGWKIGLTIIAAIMLLMMLGAGACFYYFSQIGDQVREDQKAAEKLGETADEQACLQEALARTEGKNAIAGAATATVFLSTCLRKSRPSRGFCDGVPTGEDKDATRKWAESKCQSLGQGNITCGAVMGAVIGHCQQRGSDPPPPPTAKPEEPTSKEKKK